MLHLSATVVLLLVSTVASSFINVYPKIKEFRDDGDPGEPLFITPYLKKGKIDEARSLAKVTHPEMEFVQNYAGYLTVDAAHNSNMFFWYFVAHQTPKTAPVVLWLQGGPGASSLFGLFTENGPFYVDNKKKTLKQRQFSWHINHHLIYIDNPVGTGWSFTDEGGYAQNEKDVGKNLYEALKQFFTMFPELQSNDFYITGESYAGKYVPALGHAILKNSRITNEKPKINLQGMAIGNGLSDPLHQMNYGDYLYQLGLIDDNGRQEFVQCEKRGLDCIKKRDFDCAFNAFDELINMDESPNGSIFKNLTGFNTYFNYLKPDGTDDSAMGEFLQRSDTRRAIHVGNKSFHDLDGENKVEIHLKNDVMDSVSDWVSELLSHYKVLIYNGQLDIIVAYPLTENYLRHMNFNGSEDYKTAKRYVWHVDNEVAGYVKHAGNLTEVLVRAAGHMAPADQPKWVLDMLLRMTTKKGFIKN